MLKRLTLSVCLWLFATTSFANIDRDPQLQKIFQQGMSAASKADYQTATEYFRLMLKNNPNLLRPRLELARALYKNGDYRVAKYHFEQVLSVNLPSNVRSNVNHFLTLIRQQLPSFDFSLNVLFNEKIQKRTKKVIYLGGIAYSGDNAPYENTGITQDSYALAINGKIPINPKQQTFAKLRLEYSEIIDSENDSVYLKATVGKHYSLSKSATITPEIGVHYLNYQNKKLYNGKTFGLQYFKPVNQANYLSFAYDYKQFNYIESFKTSTGEQNKFSATFTYLPSISNRLDSTLTLLKSNAQDKAQAFDRLGLTLSYNQDLYYSWNVGVSFTKNRTHYRSASTLDNGVKKKDKRETFEITILNKLWQINNIAPKLIIGKSKNSSNIDNYGESEPYITLGFTQKF
jgi:hypothetical protein